MSYCKEDYVKFKKELGASLYETITGSLSRSAIEQLLDDSIKIHGKGLIEKMQPYINILSLFSQDDKLQIIVEPNLLITIDNEVKELSWVVSCNNYDIENFCKKSKFEV